MGYESHPSNIQHTKKKNMVDGAGDGMKVVNIG